jgi:signal transduction histidine kinase
MVVIDVEDDGPGFGALPTVNGIGLCSARRLVEDAGGVLETGRGGLGGALVRITLPAVPASEVSDEDTAV